MGRLNKVKDYLMATDAFKRDTPKMNLAGKEMRPSWCGVVVTAFLLLTIAAYGSFKLEVLLERTNPSI